MLRYRADVLGVVLNSCSASELEPHYGYYYGEESPKSRGAKDKKADGAKNGSGGPNGSRPAVGPVASVGESSTRSK